MNQQNTDPFSAYKVNKLKKEEPVSIENKDKFFNDSQDPFSSYRIKESKDIPGIYEIGRHAARIGSRVAETIGGIPGDVESLIQSGLLSLKEKILGRELREEEKKYYEHGTDFPTSHELKTFSEEKTGGLTKAEGNIEKRIDEYVETATSLLGPIKFRKALGIAAGSELAKEGIKTLGLGKGEQEAAKFGTMVMLTALNPGGAMKYASQNYDKARSLSKGASINVVPMKESLTSLRKSLEEGVTTTAKNAVIKPIDDLLSKIERNKLPIHELMSAKRDLSSIMKDPALLNREKKLLKKVGKDISNAIKPYEKINPEFGKVYRGADEIYGAIMEGTKAQDFVKKHAGIKSILGTVVAETAIGHPEYIPYTAGAAAVAHGGAKIADFMTRLSKSNELKKYYSKALEAAIKKDLPAFRKYSDKIDEEFE